MDETCPRTNYTRFPAKKRSSETQPIEEVEKFNEKEKQVGVELIWHYYPYSKEKIFVLMNLYNHKREKKG